MDLIEAAGAGGWNFTHRGVSIQVATHVLNLQLQLLLRSLGSTLIVRAGRQ